ncbi:hypothetical protein CKO_03948 [Citrobacter koseri ATCC BAA-895]|uniref:Uncharacterized protein n=1 Tax=Citrobacter koseri (strain ATCC BAA-895 / CDC 4225-83 / SGSC4696) TaxID=290338 RepID=A8ANF7_CITK8|nr:hypothetical protein CKO_03948 [Citrobacter koseri ATCC BAA-895]
MYQIGHGNLRIVKLNESMVQVCQRNLVNLLMLLKKIAEKIQIAPMKD